jgi:hypothetical protein
MYAMCITGAEPFGSAPVVRKKEFDSKNHL